MRPLLAMVRSPGSLDLGAVLRREGGANHYSGMVVRGGGGDEQDGVGDVPGGDHRARAAESGGVGRLSTTACRLADDDAGLDTAARNSALR
jgi:hypothetical protein